MELQEFPEDGEISCLVELVGPNSAILTLTSTDGGIGDMLDGESPQELKNEMFGVIVVCTEAESEPPELQSDWFPDQEDSDCYHSFRAQGVNGDELRELVGSLDLCDGQ